MLFGFKFGLGLLAAYFVVTFLYGLFVYLSRSRLLKPMAQFVGGGTLLVALLIGVALSVTWTGLLTVAIALLIWIPVVYLLFGKLFEASRRSSEHLS
jgi:hypothetical protein